MKTSSETRAKAARYERENPELVALIRQTLNKMVGNGEVEAAETEDETIYCLPERRGPK